MKKIVAFLIVSSLISFSSHGQNDVQTSIHTSQGIFTISQTKEGKDMIVFSSRVWDQMVKGTKYVSGNIRQNTNMRVIIQIAGKGPLHCLTGIGFSCGIFDWEGTFKLDPAVVNNKNRFSDALLQMAGISAVKIIFLDKVDWNSLQNDNN
jgi:hypothetical protein